MPLDRSAVDAVVGSTSDHRLFALERLALRRAVGPLARHLGYDGA